MRLCVLSLMAAVSALVAAAPAGAATVSFDPGTGLRVTAAPGERNDVVLELDVGRVEWVVRDAGTPPVASTGCAPAAEGVRCSLGPDPVNANRVYSVDLGDLDDRFDAVRVEIERDGFVTGGPGADVLVGGRGVDLLDAGDGDDDVQGFSGDDRLLGGAGRDLLRGGSGSDRFEGGDGLDTVSYAGSTTFIAATLDGRANDQERSTATGAVVAIDHIVGGVENLVGSGLADVLVGDGGFNRIEGGAGDDRISGGPGGMLFSRPLQRCCLAIGDPVESPTSADVPPPSAAVTTFPRLAGFTVRLGDTLLGGPGRDNIGGAATHDQINGEAGRDQVNGGEGDDRIFSREGEADLVVCDGGTADSATVDLRDSPAQPEVSARSHACEHLDVGELREQPHLLVRASRLRVRDGRAAVPVQCPSATRRCAGTLRLRGARSTRYRLRRGRRGTVRVAVPRRRGRLRLESRESGRHGPRVTVRTVSLLR